MNVRITLVLISALLYSRVAGLAQIDAQDRTQRFFDNHKGADVVNPNRALTDRIRQPHALTHSSTLPAFTPVPDATPATKRKVGRKQPRNVHRERDVVAEDQVNQSGQQKPAKRDAQMLAEATPPDV